MVMFLVLHPMESISLNSFVLLEHLAMLLTSTLAIKREKERERERERERLVLLLTASHSWFTRAKQDLGQLIWEGASKVSAITLNTA